MKAVIKNLICCVLLAAAVPTAVMQVLRISNDKTGELRKSLTSVEEMVQTAAKEADDAVGEEKALQKELTNQSQEMQQLDAEATALEQQREALEKEIKQYRK